MNHLPLETLHLYLDDQLDPPERAAAASHLVSCVACQQELAQLEQLFAALTTLPPAPLPLDLTPRVLHAIAPQPWRSPLAWAALVAQLALAALLLWLQSSRLSPLLREWLTRGWSLPAPSSLDPLALLGSLFSFVLGQLDLDGLWAALSAPVLLPSVPALALAPTQWALLFVVAGALWLLGNRLLVGAAEVQEVAR